ncbi:MAG: AbrB/MazE/SpoVT family DNA-binding domain-containing protein [Rhodospirillales bacterium]
MDIAKVTSKGQLTLPRSVREHLGIKAGDFVSFAIQGDVAVVHKVAVHDKDYLQSIEQTLAEWNSEEDERAWDDL